MKRVRQRGSAIIEFSLAIPLLVSLFLGVWQFGYAYYLYNELEQAVRAGARYASVRKYDVAGYTTAVQKAVVYGDPLADTSTAKPLVPNLSLADVVVTPTPSTGLPLSVQVSIKSYPIGTFWTITLKDKPSTAFPYVGG
jgi:Flp pilus assembly protein TadG